jgi:NADH:ubiquinone oxidoreductase subunit 5 (subunit L)/multisubunit Na+/H+ antiporter MnhA subunit
MNRKLLVAIVNLSGIFWVVVAQTPVSKWLILIVSLVVVNIALFAAFKYKDSKVNESANSTPQARKNRLLNVGLVIAVLSSLYWLWEDFFKQ